MSDTSLQAPLKIIAWVVIALMAAAIAYAAWISLTYWNGIGV